MPVSTDTHLQSLVDLAKNGDDRAKTLLLDHACDRLLKLTRKMFRGYPGLRRWEQTDDVFQNSLIRLHRALAAVEVESVRHFFNLAAEQVRRELLDLKKHYYGTLGDAANHHTDHQPSDDDGGSLSRYAAEPDDLDRWAEFHAGVEGLPKEQKEVVNLLYYEGLSQEEVAELLGIGVRTVKRRWQAAKLRLHEVLCDDEPG
jgi:RNA polymerase sigma factor (sigma-70 family)